MIYPLTPYKPSTGLVWPDTRCGLAVEERDLLEEAGNQEFVATALVQTVQSMYPVPISRNN